MAEWCGDGGNRRRQMAIQPATETTPSLNKWKYTTVSYTKRLFPHGLLCYEMRMIMAAFAYKMMLYAVWPTAIAGSRLRRTTYSLEKKNEKIKKRRKKLQYCVDMKYMHAPYICTPNICNRNEYIQDKVICKIILLYVICSFLVLLFFYCAQTLDGRFVGRLNLHTDHSGHLAAFAILFIAKRWSIQLDTLLAFVLRQCLG